MKCRNILVRSGHDRVQAFRNTTWGMGGLTAPNMQKNGVVEQNLDITLDSNRVKPRNLTHMTEYYIFTLCVFCMTH